MSKFIIESYKMAEGGIVEGNTATFEGTKELALEQAKNLSQQGQNVVVYEAIAEIKYEPVVHLLGESTNPPAVQSAQRAATKPQQVLELEADYQIVRDFASGARVICICGTMFEYGSRQMKCPQCGKEFPIEEARQKRAMRNVPKEGVA